MHIRPCLFQCFSQLSQAYGLHANPQKCSIYFGGVNQAIQTQILSYIGIPRGSASKHQKDFGYSVPPLLDKMLGKTTSWTFRFLSYAGILQLLKQPANVCLPSDHIFFCFSSFQCLAQLLCPTLVLIFLFKHRSSL
uniref:Putative ovule protein n=1 Tax=Solanum chacoense TaxID=4108 RepID=A0A0V0GNC2_SOLCH